MVVVVVVSGMAVGGAARRARPRLVRAEVVGEEVEVEVEELDVVGDAAVPLARPPRGPRSCGAGPVGLS